MFEAILFDLLGGDGALKVPGLGLFKTTQVPAVFDRNGNLTPPKNIIIFQHNPTLAGDNTIVRLFAEINSVSPLKAQNEFELWVHGINLQLESSHKAIIERVGIISLNSNNYIFTPSSELIVKINPSIDKELIYGEEFSLLGVFTEERNVLNTASLEEDVDSFSPFSTPKPNEDLIFSENESFNKSSCGDVDYETNNENNSDTNNENSEAMSKFPWEEDFETANSTSENDLENSDLENDKPLESSDSFFKQEEAPTKYPWEEDNTDNTFILNDSLEDNLASSSTTDLNTQQIEEFDSEHKSTTSYPWETESETSSLGYLSSTETDLATEENSENNREEGIFEDEIKGEEIKNDESESRNETESEDRENFNRDDDDDDEIEPKKKSPLSKILIVVLFLVLLGAGGTLLVKYDIISLPSSNKKDTVTVVTPNKDSIRSADSLAKIKEEVKATEVIAPTIRDTEPIQGYHVIVGCFKTEQNAQMLLQMLKRKYPFTRILPKDGKWYKVSVRRFNSYAEAARFKPRFAKTVKRAWIYQVR